MSLSILCTRFGGAIEGAEAVAKSMPDFFEKLDSLGVQITKEYSK
jgi:3-phosphoshikimate 1-carboxyvinyltransferase